MQYLFKIMKRGFLIFVVILIINISFISASYPCSSITHYGITWTFDKEYQCDQFVNGDYWVLDEGTGINIIKIDPAPKEDFYQDALPSYDCETPNLESAASNYKIHGSMINPGPDDGQAYDSRASGFNEDAWINPPFSSSPLNIIGNSSLISSISFTDYCKDGYPNPYGGAMDNALRPTLKEASILTVLGEIPDSNAFRPWYSDDEKIFYNTENINYSKLKSLQRTSSAPNISEYTSLFTRVWIDHLGNWINEAIQPKDNMPQYGRSYSRVVSDAALMLNSDYSLEEKEILAMHVIQNGIDLYGIIKNGGEDHWTANGGISQGRKFPIIFAGYMLDDNEMIKISEAQYGEADYVSFHEDEQTFYISQETVDITNGETWDPDERATLLSYEADDIGLPEWGIRHQVRPVADNKHWTATYRHLNALTWAGFILAIYAMDLKEEWNHDAIFDYQDRHMDVMAGDKYRLDSDFQEEMWDLYRDDYGCTWKRIDVENIYSQGYYDCDGVSVNCDEIISCSDYPNQRAFLYDPCNLVCQVFECNDEIDIDELIAYIQEWKSNSVSQTQLINAINEWKINC